MAANESAPTSVEHYRTLFTDFEAGLNGGTKRPVHGLRRAAVDRLAETGFPTRRDEAWRHTNPAPLVTPSFRPASRAKATSVVEAWTIDGLTGPRLVFVNGHFDEAASRRTELPEGLRVERLADAFAAGDDALLDEHLGASGGHESGGFAALNTAFLTDGVLIAADEGVVFDEPVEILHVSTGGAEPSLVTPRTLVVAAAGSRLQFVETFAGHGDGQHLTVPVTEVVLGAGAQVEHTRLQRDADGGHHSSLLHVHEATDSRFTSHSVNLGGRLVRNDVTTVLDGEGIVSTLNGLFLPNGEEHVDNYTSIEHAAPNCESHELYKGVLADSAHGVFRGKIHVHQVAQKTDAYQSNQNLLLSDDAEIMSKPQLEIYADDVKCSHGSTTGELDESAIFYLRARGIGETTARRVLTRAFAGELVDRISHDVVRAHVETCTLRRLDEILKDA